MIARQSPQSTLLMIGLMVFAGWASGCSSASSTPPVPTEDKVDNPVEGRVIMGGGRSPNHCEVYFYREDATDIEAKLSRGACDEFGYFQMSTSSTNDGTPPGKFKVLFFQTAKFPETFGKPSPVDALGGVYMNLEQPKYTVEIPKGGKRDLSFEVTPLSKEEIDAALEAYLGDRSKSKGGKSK